VAKISRRVEGDMNPVKLYILDAVADDYEDLETVVGEAERQASAAGSRASREGVVQGLEDLVSQGYVQCYSFSRSSGKFEPHPFTRALAQDLWFYVTPQGKKIVESLP
jgi:hypothetical protein